MHTAVLNSCNRRNIRGRASFTAAESHAVANHPGRSIALSRPWVCRTVAACCSRRRPSSWCGFSQCSRLPWILPMAASYVTADDSSHFRPAAGAMPQRIENPQELLVWPHRVPSQRPRSTAPPTADHTTCCSRHHQGHISSGRHGSSISTIHGFVLA